jgi:D-3-phosphoglycerate dehydrogenase / 2-oxoglutarate reductase
MSDSMPKILCITPIKHLKGVFQRLSEFGEIIYIPNISKLELKEFLQNNNISYIFTNPNKQGFILDSEVLKYGNLKVINTCSTGLNHIDINYCNENDINVWSLTTDFQLINDLPSTSELAFGLMLSLLRNIPSSFNDVKKGYWNYEPYIGHQIKGLTIGIIGYGRLGTIMKKLFDGWDVKILVNDPYKDCKGCNKVSKNELLKSSDVVFLHVHVTDETREMVNESFLTQMKKNSYLINTSRGELVDELSIIKYIKNGHLKGYGTDVIRDEFGESNSSELVKFSYKNNVIITPHVGGMTIEGQTKAYMWAVSKFKDVS